jgi:hypothetical protein
VQDLINQTKINNLELKMFHKKEEIGQLTIRCEIVADVPSSGLDQGKTLSTVSKKETSGKGGQTDHTFGN